MHKVTAHDAALRSILGGLTGGVDGFKREAKEGKKEWAEAGNDIRNAGSAALDLASNLTPEAIASNTAKQLENKEKLSKNKSFKAAETVLETFTGIPTVVKSGGDPKAIGSALFELGSMAIPSAKNPIKAPKAKPGQIWNSRTGEVLNPLGQSSINKVPKNLNVAKGGTPVTIDVPAVEIAGDASGLGNKATKLVPKKPFAPIPSLTLAETNKVIKQQPPTPQKIAPSLLPIERKIASGKASTQEIIQYRKDLNKAAIANLQNSANLPGAKDIAKLIEQQPVTLNKNPVGVQAIMAPIRAQIVNNVIRGYKRLTGNFGRNREFLTPKEEPLTEKSLQELLSGKKLKQVVTFTAEYQLSQAEELVGKKIPVRGTIRVDGVEKATDTLGYVEFVPVVDRALLGPPANGRLNNLDGGEGLKVYQDLIPPRINAYNLRGNLIGTLDDALVPYHYVVKPDFPSKKMRDFQDLKVKIQSNTDERLKALFPIN